MRRRATPCRITSSGEYLSLQPASRQSREYAEDSLQRLISNCPDILPVDEFGEQFRPLINLGREIDCIDNLFISPSGYLTIVETKLWRNPQATREVVAQILQYAVNAASWSYEQLEAKCRSALAPAPIGGGSLFDYVSATYPDLGWVEADFIDSVATSLRHGRFLLLVVGDGIRRGLEHLLDALHAHPRLQFTFGLVELQIFKDTQESGSTIVVPSVVAKSVEITRAVVHVETSGEANVRVELPSSDSEAQSRARPPSEQAFLAEHLKPTARETVQQILAVSRELGAFVELGASSLSVKLRDPRGSKQKLTLFGFTKSGDLYTGWLPGQLRSIGISPSIAIEWVDSVADLFPGIQPKGGDGSSLSRNVLLRELEERVDDFLSTLRRTVQRIITAADAIDAL